MKFVLKPSLEHMALVEIGILLWKQNYAKLCYNDDLCRSQWEKVEGRVIEKVPQLSLPQLLKEKVFGVIKPIGIQIFEWMEYHRQYDACIEFKFLLDLNVPSHLSDLCWTPQGTVDRKRTAEVLIKYGNLNVVTRYVLACDYCMEDDIVQFWNRLTEYPKDYDWHHFPVVRFWSDNMKRGIVGHISYVDVFYQSVRVGNKVAAEYFLQKVTAREKEATLVEAAKWMYKTDVLCFLISEMDEEQQMLVFKNDPCRVLPCFLQWPFQVFFIGVANCMWDFLSRNNFDETLRAIISKVRDGYKDYNYQNLFREFWQESPGALKSFITNEIDTSRLLWCLFDIKDKENIKLILKDVTITAKEKFIYCDETKNICQRYIRDNKWDFLEFFIRECFPSKNEMLKFKEEMEKHRMTRSFKQKFATKKHTWDKFFSSSDVFICKSDKRNVEERESSSSKRLRSLQ